MMDHSVGPESLHRIDRSAVGCGNESSKEEAAGDSERQSVSTQSKKRTQDHQQHHIQTQPP